MAYLINRNVSGRLPCLHGICQYIVAQFGDKQFTIKDLKYDENKKYNIHNFSPCAVKMGESNYITCRYLDNPLSPSKCALVQSVNHDPQKSKLASDIMNALNGLGLVKRDGNTATITELGKRFAASERKSPEWQLIAKQAVLSYGPFIGMLYTAILKADADGNFVRSDLEGLGYPSSTETVMVEGKYVLLSSGSQNDTITRTRAVLLSWGISAGIITSSLIEDAYEYIMAPSWNVNLFTLNKSKIPNSRHMVQSPLSYTNLAKNTRSLRERGQQAVREVTVQYEPVIKNRRLALVYLLNKAAQDNKQADFKKLCGLIKAYPKLFVVSESQYDAVMASELKIAFITGLPYDIQAGIITPLCTVDEATLLQGAPSEVRKTLDAMIEKRTVYET